MYNLSRLILCLFLLAFTHSAFAKECDSTLLVEEIIVFAVESENIPQYENLLTPEEAQSILCQKNDLATELIQIAKQRLSYQTELANQTYAAGKMSRNDYRFFIEYFTLMAQNIAYCETAIADWQQNGYPKYKKNLAHFYVKENGVARINMYSRTTGALYRTFTSHIGWIGKILYDFDKHVCEAQVFR